MSEESKVNPANTVEKRELPANFQPMSAGVKRLEVPERAGYHRRWFRSDPGRIAKAQRAGYTFVDPRDVDLNNHDLGGDAKVSGNTDMGSSLVSVVSGEGLDQTGQPQRLYLMECPIEYYKASQKVLEERNDAVAEALKGNNMQGSDDETMSDREKRYMKGQAPALFTKNRRRT